MCIDRLCVDRLCIDRVRADRVCADRLCIGVYRVYIGDRCRFIRFYKVSVFRYGKGVYR